MMPTPSHVPAFPAMPLDAMGSLAAGSNAADRPATAVPGTFDGLSGETRAEFLAQVAHELRTPLTTLNAALGLMRRRIDAPETDPMVVHLFGLARSGTERLMALVEDWLDVAAMDAGSFQLARAAVTPGTLADAATERLRAAAGRRGVTIAATVASTRPVLADRARLERVLVHLLERALVAAPAGGTVTLHADDDGTFVRIAVVHTGQRRADDVPDGMAGLGLTLCRAIVERHGGTLCVGAGEDARRTSCRIPAA
jgi:signal transduction histidine kinase